jgi:hypothetical protein
VRSYFLAAVLVVAWVLSWWGSRRFRLWFTLLAPFGAVAAIVLAFLSVPAGSCTNGCVEGWANNVDSSENIANALAALPVSLVLAAITLIAELVLFVRRNPPAPKPGGRPPTDRTPRDPTREDPKPSQAPADQAPTPADRTSSRSSPTPPQSDQAPTWSDLMRRPPRSDRTPTE